jgi:UDP-glucose 4-epimerase
MVRDFSESFSAVYEDCPVLITGGNGFIGQHLNRHLGQLKARVTNFAGDIREEAAVNRAVIGQKIIYHLAGHSGAVASNQYPLKDLDINCRGTLNLLEACRQFNPEARVIFPSSRLVYGHPQEVPVTEQHPTHPTSIYGIHKLTIENYFKLYYELYGVSSVLLRITNPYGLGYQFQQQNYGILNIFMELALANATINLYGNGSQLRDFIYIDDLVEALLIVGQEPRIDGEVFNVSSGEAISLREAAEIIVAVTCKGQIEQIPWPSGAKQVETGDFLADITKIKQVTGWHPRTEFKNGIKKALDNVGLLQAYLK